MQVVNPDARAGFISPAHGGPALVLGQPKLFRTRLCASEKVRAKLEGKSAREGPRNELRLVVSAFAEPRRMERYWDDDIRGETFGIAGGKLGEPVSEPGSERGDAIVFYKQNRADHGIVIVGKAAREAEAISFGTAEAAEKLWRVRCELRDDRAAATCTPRR